MTTLFLYIMAASSDPDKVECVVPYPIEDTEIFFGPCKRLLRKELRDRYLKTSNDVRLEDDIFIVGVNGKNRQRCRKIVWAGRVAHLMTFETAYKKLTHNKYQEMRKRDSSPLHVKPLYGGDEQFRGYEHCSSLHEEDDIWVRDFSHNNNPHVQKRGKQLLLAPNANRHQAFPRDCCLLLERVFFADGVGISITDDMLDVLKKSQDGKQDIDKYAIFGYRADCSVNGLTGRWLEISGENAKKMMRLIKADIPASSGTSRRAKEFHPRACTCT